MGKWERPTQAPPPLFLGEKEKNLVKQVNDEIIERVVGQQVLYFPIDIEHTDFHPLYGEAIEKSFLPPVRVFARVEYQGVETNVIDNIEDVLPTVQKNRDTPVLLCHDQEPLDFDLYNDSNLVKQLDTLYPVLRKMIQNLLDKGITNLNLRWVQPNWHRFDNRLDQPYWTLLHSEFNSPEVIKYESSGLFK